MNLQFEKQAIAKAKTIQLNGYQAGNKGAIYGAIVECCVELKKEIKMGFPKVKLDFIKPIGNNPVYKICGMQVGLKQVGNSVTCYVQFEFDYSKKIKEIK